MSGIEMQWTHPGAVPCCGGFWGGPATPESDSSGNQTWPGLGKWLLETLWSPEGHSLCISTHGSGEVVYGPALGECGNFKGRERVLLSKLKGLVKGTDVGLWPSHPPGSSWKTVHCVLLLTWLCLVLHRPVLTPHTITFLELERWNTWRHKKSWKIIALGCSPTLVKHKVILCCSSTRRRVQSVAQQQELNNPLLFEPIFAQRITKFRIWSLYSYWKIAEGCAAVDDDPCGHCPGQWFCSQVSVWGWLWCAVCAPEGKAQEFVSWNL